MTLPDPAKGVWSAPDALTIYEVRKLEASFSGSGVPSRDWLFDLSNVNEIDSAGLQWLLAVRNRLFTDGYRLVFVNVPGAIAGIIKLISLEICQCEPFPELVTDV
ncbi:STAS domain-containing protein [Marinobacter sp. M-5]|uniref:STAS domain-containing protein n=1 Tax=Marinobacter sp. M-5 TaxID=3081089 RepID=UPI00293CB576|nr:STAS domain-containing protein [Marinobacter sp. M-5]MDV3504205.1 STAS domain-containing protein [Marinobacter sp. M-5]